MTTAEGEINKDYGFDILDWEDSRPKEFSFYKHMFAGSMAGIMEHCGMFPFDTIKTHMQASQTKLGFFRTMKTLYQQEGFLKMWKGANVIASGCIPAHACYFTTYEVAKERFGIDDGNTHFMISGCIGALATISHDAFLTPSDWIKQRMQLTRMGTLEWIRDTIKNEGFRALYKAYPITILMNIPFAFVIVSANENIKVYAKPKIQKHPLPYYFGWAFIAGWIAGFATNPLDVVKTRLQTQNHCSCVEDKGLDLNVEDCKNPVDQTLKLKYKNVKHAIGKVFREEGMSGFMKGSIPRMCIVAPGWAISWGTYEMFKSFLIKDDDKQG